MRLTNLASPDGLWITQQCLLSCFTVSFNGVHWEETVFRTSASQMLIRKRNAFTLFASRAHTLRFVEKHRLLMCLFTREPRNCYSCFCDSWKRHLQMGASLTPDWLGQDKTQCQHNAKSIKEMVFPIWCWSWPQPHPTQSCPAAKVLW